MDLTEAPSSVPNQMEATDAETDASSATDAKEPLPTAAAAAAAGQQIKKSRKRKKQLFNQIRQQIEFYFSDANLSKDRFLKKLMEKDSGIL